MSEVLFSIGEAGQNLNIQFYNKLSHDHHLIFGCREAAHDNFCYKLLFAKIRNDFLRL